MIAVDTSLLSYGVNRYAPEHARATRVLEDLANGDHPWALPWPVVHEFLAFATHPHAVARPLTPGDAWAFVESLLASATVRPLGPTERHAAVMAEVLASSPGGMGGVQTAAILREHGVRELLSADRAMRRFAFLDVRDPVHGDTWTPTARPVRRYRVLRTVTPSSPPPAGAASGSRGPRRS
jgi:toxin-antitoxin system PIN domain toxin